MRIIGHRFDGKQWITPLRPVDHKTEEVGEEWGITQPNQNRNHGEPAQIAKERIGAVPHGVFVIFKNRPVIQRIFKEHDHDKKVQRVAEKFGGIELALRELTEEIEAE